MSDIKHCVQSCASALIMRLTLATVFFPHGAQKILGWFGGHGFDKTVSAFTGPGMDLPKPLAICAVITEFAAPILLLFGFGTRIAAFGLAILMAVAMKFHVENGFFMNWFGVQKGEGYEFHILAIGLALAIVIKGAGKISLDHLLGKKGCCQGGSCSCGDK